MKDSLEILGEVLLIFLILVLAIALIMIPISRSSFNAEINRYNAFKQTLNQARTEDMSELERASILTKIADWNMDIEATKYWNETIFDVYIPDEVAELELLK